MIAPHTSTRYAVVFSEAFLPEADGYSLAAVHAVGEESGNLLLVSVVAQPFGSGHLAFGPPKWVSRGSILYLAPNHKEAAALRSALMDEDRREEARPMCAECGKRRARVMVAPGVEPLCDPCAVDWQRNNLRPEER